MPMLLPVTGAALLPIGAYAIFHSLRIAYYRLSNQRYHDINLGNGKQGDNSDSSSSGGNALGHDPLYCATRSHGNFFENVPLALLLTAAAELNGASKKLLTYALGTFLALRVLHAEAGIMIQGGLGLGRTIGFYGTMVWVGTLGVWNFLLTKDYWTAL